MRKWLTAVVMAIVALGALEACGPESSTMPKREFYQVVYKVKADAASVTFLPPNSDKQKTIVRGTWERTYLFRSGEYVFLEAQDQGTGDGNCVNVQIWIEGVKTQEEKSCTIKYMVVSVVDRIE